MAQAGPSTTSAGLQEEGGTSSAAGAGQGQGHAAREYTGEAAEAGHAEGQAGRTDDNREQTEGDGEGGLRRRTNWGFYLTWGKRILVLKAIAMLLRAS